MRLIFAGTPEFAVPALRALLRAGHAVVLALTQPDRPSGRGLRLQPCPVKRTAAEHGIALCQPRSLRLDGRHPADAQAAHAAILAARADAMVVAAYGLILPQWVLDALERPAAAGAAGLGCLNIHASLLPRWRGAAPIHRAIEAGDAQTGVCIMQMDAGLDTGAVLLRAVEPIQHDGAQADSTGSLQERLATLGAELIVQALAQAASGRPLPAQPQRTDGVCYAQKVEKAQACIDWNDDAAQLERRIRAFDPQPGAWTMLAGEVLKVWRAQVVPDSPAPRSPPGSVLAVDPAGITVACGQGRLRLLQLQRAGGRRLPVAEFLRGQTIVPGVRFGPARADD